MVRGGGGNKIIPQRPFSTLEQIKNAVDNIVALNRPWYNVTFSGGEPTIHPHIFDTIELLNENLGERLNHVAIITNGSRNETFYRNVAELSKSVSIHMAISIHTDHVEMDHILNLIENLSPTMRIYLPLMFNPAKREKVHSIYKTLLEYRKKFRFFMDVCLVRAGGALDPRYISEDLEWRKKTVREFSETAKSVADKFPPLKKRRHVNHFFYDIEDNGKREIVYENDHALKQTNGMLNFKDMYCISHSALLRIEETGWCKGMVCNADSFTCNIYEKDAFLKNLEKFIRPVKCPNSLCGCSANDCIPKFASEEEAKKFVEIIQARQNRLFLDERI